MFSKRKILFEGDKILYDNKPVFNLNLPILDNTDTIISLNENFSYKKPLFLSIKNKFIKLTPKLYGDCTVFSIFHPNKIRLKRDNYKEISTTIRDNHTYFSSISNILTQLDINDPLKELSDDWKPELANFTTELSNKFDYILRNVNFKDGDTIFVWNNIELACYLQQNYGQKVIVVFGDVRWN